MARLNFSSRFGLIAGFAVLSALMTFGAIAQTPAVSTVNPNSSAGELVKPAQEKGGLRKAVDRILSLDIEVGGDLSADLLQGLRVGIGYRYKTEPSYKNGYHWRIDNGRLKAGVNLGELLGYDQPRIGLSADEGIDFMMVRPYKSKPEASAASPFGYDFTKVANPKTTNEELLKWLPFTSERALANMKVGELFTFKSELTVLMDASSLPVSSGLGLMGFTHYIVSGLYQISIVRLPQDKVELRMVALRQDKKGGGVSIGFAGGHKILGVRIIDRRIEKILNVTEMFRADRDFKTSSLQMVQYRLDLSKKEVRDAYDGIATNLVAFNTAKIANPFQSIDKLTAKLISDVTPFETIYKREYEQQKNVKKEDRKFSVDRSFKGKNDVAFSDSSGFKIAPILFNFFDGKEYYENMMITSNADESLNYYRLHTYKRTNKFAALLSFFKETSIGMASLLFDSDKDQGFGDLRDISFSWQYRDKSMDAGEMDDVKAAVQHAVPQNVYRMINWGAFNQRRDFSNAGFMYRMVIDPRALTALKGNSAIMIYNRLVNYILSVPEPKADPQAGIMTAAEGGQPPMTRQEALIAKYTVSMWSIATKLAAVFDSRYTNAQRSFDFGQLRFNDLFGEIGPGFLVSMLPAENLPKLVSFEVSMSADDTPSMPTFQYGTPPDRQIYEAAAYIQAVLSTDEFETITQMMKSADHP